MALCTPFKPPHIQHEAKYNTKWIERKAWKRQSALDSIRTSQKITWSSMCCSSYVANVFHRTLSLLNSEKKYGWVEKKVWFRSQKCKIISYNGYWLFGLVFCEVVLYIHVSLHDTSLFRGNVYVLIYCILMDILFTLESIHLVSSVKELNRY